MFTAGTDYEEGPYSVMIPKGQESADFCISIINDTMLDGDEAFIIKIDETKLHPDIILMSPMQATVTIIDDECKHKNCTC